MHMNCTPCQYTLIGGFMGYGTVIFAGVHEIGSDTAMYSAIGISGFLGAVGGSWLDHVKHNRIFYW